MASIKLDQLQSTGSELFQDSESFLNDMGDIVTGKQIGRAHV